MTFLDDPRVDIYFSTWDKSIVHNDRLNLHIEDDITEEKVRQDLGLPATVLVEQSSGFVEKRYNSKMIHRWLKGFELIKNSGKEYDYVMVLRPDLFFNTDFHPVINLDKLSEIEDKLLMTWVGIDIHTRGFLQDQMFISSYKKADELFSRLTIAEWENAVEGDWHKWWYSFCYPIFREIKNLDCHFTFGRALITSNHTFSDVWSVSHLWRDATIINDCQRWGREHVLTAWPEEVIASAEKRLKDGTFDKYTKPKTAIVISGMLRNYDAALLSLPIFGDGDRYLVTWKSAGENAIEDYKKKANIKEAFIIDDAEFDSEFNVYPFNSNSFKMLFLWSKIPGLICNSYTKYVIIRPDGYYWTTDANCLEDTIKNVKQFKVDTASAFDGRVPTEKGISDRLLVISDDSISLLMTIVSDMICIVNERTKNGNGHCIHWIFYDWCKQKNLDPLSRDLETLVDTVFVRDTFELLKTDSYDKDLYAALFYDSAAWWRRMHSTKYGGTLRVKN